MAQGYIRNKADMKFLILFISDVIGDAMQNEILLQAVLSDECADYFTYTEALTELCADGFMVESEEGYSITEPGRSNFYALGKVLPYSVRRNAQNAATRAIASAQRNACIKTTTKKLSGTNHYTTELSLSDGQTEILSLSLLTVKSEQGADIEANFSRNAEKIYLRILEALVDEYPQKEDEEDPSSTI